MSAERDRIVQAVTGALIVAVVVGLLLALPGGCVRADGDEGGGGPCDWFALAAAPAAPSKGSTSTRKAEPSRPLTKVPAPSASASKRPAHRDGVDVDLCD